MHQTSTYLEAVLLGVIQGVAEFLPISSSGHLVILQGPLNRMLGGESMAVNSLQLNIALHFGTLLSILCVYRRDLRELLGKPRVCRGIVIATLPIVIVGLALKDRYDTMFEGPMVAGCGLLVSALLLWLGQGLQRSRHSLESMTASSALVVGLFQALAIVPGISRSGSTIAGGMLTGLKRETATEFSFFIAIPAILGATILMTAKGIQNAEFDSGTLSILLVGAVTAFFVGIVALRFLIRIVSSGKLHWFAIYCAVVGTVTIILQFIDK